MLAAELLSEAADACHADLADIKAGRRYRPCVRAKKATVYALRRWTDNPRPFAQIGRFFSTDHSTAINLHRAAKDLRDSDPHFRQLTDILVEHARSAVASGRVGEADAGLVTIEPAQAKEPKRSIREIEQVVLAVVSFAAELWDADFESIMFRTRRDAVEFEATAAAIWAMRRPGEADPLSLSEIGRVLQRSKSTIMSADRSAIKLRSSCREFATLTDQLQTEAERRLL